MARGPMWTPEEDRIVQLDHPLEELQRLLVSASHPERNLDVIKRRRGELLSGGRKRGKKDPPAPTFDDAMETEDVAIIAVVRKDLIGQATERKAEYELVKSQVDMLSERLKKVLDFDIEI